MAHHHAPGDVDTVLACLLSDDLALQPSTPCGLLTPDQAREHARSRVIAKNVRTLRSAILEATRLSAGGPLDVCRSPRHTPVMSKTIHAAKTCPQPVGAMLTFCANRSFYANRIDQPAACSTKRFPTTCYVGQVSK